MTAVEQDQPFSPLVADILGAMASQTAAVTNQVMDNYQRQIEDLEAEVWAIREGVSRLLAGPYMPHPDSIWQATFHPAQELIDEYKANKEVGW